MDTYSKKVISINFTASLEELVQSVNWDEISSVIVVDDFGEIFGIITDSDITRIEKQGRSLKMTQAWEVCSHRLLEVDVDAPLGEIAKLMLEHHCHHVLLHNKKNASGNQLVGVVSSLDVIKELLDNGASTQEKEVS